MFKQKSEIKRPGIKHFCVSRWIISGTLAIALITCWATSNLHAQEKPEIAKLQKQLQVLQNQIATLNQQNRETQTADQDSRVRSVGSQKRVQRVQPTMDEPLLIRLYDLSDLFVVSPSYPAKLPKEFADTVFDPSMGAMTSAIGQGGGGFGGGGGGGVGGSGGVFRIAPAHPMAQPTAAINRAPGEAGGHNMRAAQVSMSQLVGTIKETVEPEMWGSKQGDAGVQFLGNTLLITATDGMHSQITNLLNLFREHWGKRKTISIQTYWIRAQPGDTSDLLDEKSSQIGAGVVNADKWKQYLTAARTEKRFTYSATLTGHNNQTLHTLSGQQRQLVVGAQPFSKTEAVMWFEDAEDVDPFGNSEDDEDMNYFNRTRKIVGFHPVRKSFQSGAVFEVTPLATRGGNFVILDLHAKFNQLSKPEKNEEPTTIFVHDDERKSEVKLDHADFVTCRLNTTLRCPKDQVVLAGSMTLDPNSDQEHPNIYVFVKTMVHTITEDKSDWVPDDAKKLDQKKAAARKKPEADKKK